MEYKEIIYTLEGHICIITLNRPEALNALTNLMHIEIQDAILRAGQDDDVRAVIVTGAGRGFCAGDDIKKIFLDPSAADSKNRETWLKYLQGEHIMSGARVLLNVNKPTIAVVNGAAVGYGCDIAVMCNMRIASEKARFGEVFLRVGLIPDESLILLPRIVGLAKAYEMLLTTDIIDAQEALRIGLVNKVVPHEELMPAAMELAEKLAKKPPIAMKLAIEGVRRGLALPLEEFLQFHSMAFTFASETEDHIEGSKAFVEKREPVFKGK
ncbi:MAG: enoyl-CoA hydratase-related protein [Dehalococcoidia bacterium]|nr:enoyl-CoA hydratase-related protein [Dehalococcoidia bacterium]